MLMITIPHRSRPKRPLTRSADAIACFWMNNCMGLGVLLNSTYSSGPTPACGGPKACPGLGHELFSPKDALLHKQLPSSQQCFLWGQGLLAVSVGLTAWSSSPASSFCVQSKVALLGVLTPKPLAYPISGGANGNFVFAV